MGLRFKLFLAKMALKLTCCLAVVFMGNAVAMILGVGGSKTANMLWLFPVMILSFIMPYSGKVFRRLVYGSLIFLGTYLASFYALQTFGLKASGMTMTHKVFIGFNLLVPLLVTLATYRTVMDTLVMGTWKLIKGFFNLLFAPFRWVANWKPVANFFNSFRRRRVVNLEFTMEQIDAFGNGDTYLKGRMFEEYIAELYKTIGYDAQTTTELRAKGQLPPSIQKRGGSGEQGVDVIVEGMDNQGRGVRMIIQCKHYTGKVDNSAIQQIVAAKPLYKADHLVVITNSIFTEPAKELGRVHNVILIDRHRLPELIENAVKAYKTKYDV